MCPWQIPSNEGSVPRSLVSGKGYMGAGTSKLSDGVS